MVSFRFVVTGLFVLVLELVSQTVGAAQNRCSYSKNIAAGDASYTVTSSRANGCAVQIVDVLFSRNGKKAVRLRTDVDYLAYSALTADMNNDSVPELIVISKNSRQPGYDTADLYQLDGDTLKRSHLPPLDDSRNYRGGDTFRVDGKQLVRSFPLYDQQKTRTGTRTLTYEMKDNKLAVYVQSDSPLPAEDPAPVQVTATQDAVSSPLIKAPVQSEKPAPSTISEIVVGESSITIKTGGIPKYKTMKLEKPERIAVDFPKGKNRLSFSSMPVNKFGITRIRVGNNKGFVRLVLDTRAKIFPAHSVKAVDDTVVIEFMEPHP